MRGGSRSLSVPQFSTGTYPYMNDLEGLDACCPTVPTRLSPCLEEVHTPLPWQEWDHSLASHPDQSFRAYIQDGLWYSFHVGFNYRYSHFGVIPKGSMGKWSLILDMSSPEGRSVNDGIQESLCSLSCGCAGCGHGSGRQGQRIPYGEGGHVERILSYPHSPG